MVGTSRDLSFFFDSLRVIPTISQPHNIKALCTL